MKLITPEISWHQKEPIFSVDFCPQTWKLSSCGADFTIKIWQVKEKADGDDSVGIEFLANLDRHAKPVNVVRFSPNGKLLASGGDDGAIVLWKVNENTKNMGGDFNEDFGEDIVNKENWVMHKMLRGHIEDVYDLAWSPDSSQLLSGSVDNSAIVWDVTKGQSQKILNDHKHYVQGVCWDPRGFYIATHSSDRSCRVYAASTHKCLHNIHRNTSSFLKDGQMTKSKFSRMFMDETMQSFFRRCTFSPDGSFLFLPAGLCDGENKPRKTCYVFARGQYTRPVTHLPGSKKATVAVRCNPICYELMNDKENSNKLHEIQENNERFKIPYRMIYAVVSLDAVTFYDTQHSLPIGHCANMHYASLTDATWSSDGRLLVVSSSDGYCSFIKFDEGELGVPISFDPIEYQITQLNIRATAKKDSKKKEQEAKKKEKETAKKLAESAEKPEEANKEVTVSTPIAEDTNKEKSSKTGGTTSKPVLDKNQPTIEKLFVTPVRKRKRFSDSPASDINGSGNSTKTDIEGQNESCLSTSHNTPSTPAANDLDKTPKRPRSTPIGKTLNTSKDNSSSSTPAKKAPKRANVTTLLTFSNSTKEEENKNSSVTTQRQTCITTPPPTVKAAKRVTVTTLTTFDDDTVDSVSTIENDDVEILKSPVEIQSPLPDTSIPIKSPSFKSPITPRKTLQAVTLKHGSKQSTLEAKTKIMYSPTSTKPPKRVQVTTLTTFNDIDDNDSKATTSTDKKYTPTDSQTTGAGKPSSVIVLD